MGGESRECLKEIFAAGGCEEALNQCFRGLNQEGVDGYRGNLAWGSNGGSRKG